MNGSMSREVLLQDLLMKRSQQRKITSPCNFKERVFILTSDRISYYEGTLERLGSRKGVVELNKVQCVASITTCSEGGTPGNGWYPFQVVHEEATLYIFTLQESVRNKWVNTLKDVTRQNQCLLSKFHPSLWGNTKWPCCGQPDKKAIGCVVYTHHSDVKSLIYQKPLPPIPDEEQNTGPDVCWASPMRRLPPPPPAVEEPSHQLVALFDFGGLEPHDLPLMRGSFYELVDNHDPHWWKARNEHGQEGYVPSSYVSIVIGNIVQESEWFCKDVTRVRAEQLLKQQGKDGGYMVRDSSQPGKFTVSVFTTKPTETIKHYHIKENVQGQFFLAEKHVFSSIPELIMYHQHNAAGLVVRLRHPVNHQSIEAPTTVGFSYQKWEIDPQELTFMHELGSGQYGVVRLGQWKRRKLVAVKMIQEGAMSEEDFIEEAKVMMQLSHPRLVQLYGVCTQQRPLCIVTEYMAGGSLQLFLKAQRGSTVPELMAEICLDVCEAMSYLEAKMFLHRDLAARNCLVGEGNIVKVSDFGMTRYVLDDQYTCSMGAKFPVKWSPPEVFQYTRFSTKSDVWSFGVLMWEVYTEGHMPFEGWSNQQVVDEILRGCRLYQPALSPPTAYSIMLDCWQEKPESRCSFIELLPRIRALCVQDYSE
ncbi:tyrosine-protein kinase Tec-like [Lampetra fluviatilis]